MRTDGNVHITSCYNAMINAYAEAARLGDTIQIVEDMNNAGVIPDKITCGALVKACQRAAQPDLAFEIYKVMSQQVWPLPRNSHLPSARKSPLCGGLAKDVRSSCCLDCHSQMFDHGTIDCCCTLHVPPCWSLPTDDANIDTVGHLAGRIHGVLPDPVCLQPAEVNVAPRRLSSSGAWARKGHVHGPVSWSCHAEGAQCVIQGE